MTTDYQSDFASFMPDSGGGGAGASRALDPRHLVRMRWRIMLVVFVCLSIPLAVAAWLLIPLEYSAAASIQFLEKRVDVLASGQMNSRPNYEKWVETQVQLIQRGPILPRVLDNPTVKNLPFISQADNKLRVLQKKVFAYWSQNTQLVTVTVSSTDRDAALSVVGIIVEEYLNYALGQEGRWDQEVVTSLAERRDRAESELSTLRERISQRKKLSGAPLLAEAGEGLTAKAQAYHENLGTAQSDLLSGQAEARQYEAFIAEIEALRKQHGDSPDTPIYEHGVEEGVDRDQSVVVQKEALAQFDQNLMQIKDTYNEGQKQLKVAQQSRDAAEKALNEAKRTARTEVLDALAEQYRLELSRAQAKTEGAQARVDEFQKKIEQSDGQVMELADALADIELMEKQSQELESHLADIRRRLREKDAESDAPANILKASDPYADESPSWSKRLQALILAFGFAFVVSAGLGVFLELTDQEVRTATDMARLSGLPTLAVIPHSSLDRLPADCTEALVTIEHPQSTSADEYRRVLTRVLYPPENSAELNTCLIVSPSSGDGKTALACNLALTLAQANRRVLLIDVGARRPDVERALGIERGPGLAEMLSGQCAEDEAIHRTQYHGLHVLGPGLDGAELMGKLASRDMIELLEKAEETYDHVIVDSPPALLMADAKLLAPVVDGVIVVVGAHVSSAGKVRRCINELRQLGANVIGTVLNGVRQTPGGYLQDNLNSFYQHASGSTAAQASGGARPAETPFASPAGSTRDDFGEYEELDEPSIVLLEEEEEQPEDDKW